VIGARVLCAVFALVGVLPLALTLLARSAALNAWAAEQSSRLLEQQGLHASYGIQVNLVPLALQLTQIRLDSSDGKGPALTSDRVTARPRLFALLSGKLLLDQIEVDEPRIRVVMKDGELQNVPLKLPKASKEKKPFRAPFSVVAVTGAAIDFTLDDAHVVAKDIDVDLTTDDEGEGGSSFEIAARIGEAAVHRSRLFYPPKATQPSVATDDDTLCSLDARVRYEPHAILVRRLSAEGSADLDVTPGAAQRCGLLDTDKRKVVVAANHLRIGLPEGDARPKIDGHLRLRAPVQLAERAARLPETDGWIGFEADVRYAEDTTIPELDGHFEAHDIRLAQYHFAQEIQADLNIHKDVIRAPKLMVRISDGVANLTDVQVEPLARGVPLKAKLDITDVSFASLMRDLGVSPHPHVAWDIKELHSPSFHGTIVPLHLDAELTGRTANFVVADRAIDDPSHQRILGFKEASLNTHVAVRPQALEFQAVRSQVGKSLIKDGYCSIGFDNKLKVDVPHAAIDLEDITPLGDVALAGQADADVHVNGLFNAPQLEADASIANFMLGEMPLGNVTAAHVSFRGTTVVDLKNIKAQKGKSLYEMPQARLEFGGKASMELDGVATSGGMGLRDFLSVFKLDDDPRFAELDATLATRASLRLVIGGPEDTCGGGMVDVRAGVHATGVNLWGERFDDGDVDLEFRQIDRLAGMLGTDVIVPALTLHKYHPQGKEPSGSVLGSGRIQRGGAVHANLVMQAIPLFRVEALGALRSEMEGGISGLATVSGTLDSFDIVSDLDITPARVRGTAFGASHLHVKATQSSPTRVAGHTRCGGIIGPPFDPAAFLADASSHGEIDVDGDLAAGQVRLQKVAVTREPKPRITGTVAFHGLDLGAIRRAFTPEELRSEADLNAPEGAPKEDIDGNLSGTLWIDRARVGELEHAKIRFAPEALAVGRGTQRVVLRATKEVLTLEEDRLGIPPLVLDLQAGKGLNGAVTLRGAVTKITRDPELNAELDLSPIDLGVMVGVVPRVDRATGTLKGSVKLLGPLRSPRVEGDVHVAGAEIAVKGFPSPLSELNIDVQADAQEVKIARAQAKFAGGTVEVRGVAPFKQLLTGIGEVQVAARGIHLSPVDGVNATTDADLTVGLNAQSTEGAAARLPRVTGDVTLTQFEYVRPINLTTDLSSFGVRAKRTVVDTYDPTLDAMTMELRVKTRAPIRIKNNLVEAQLKADSPLIVSGTNQRIGLRGDLSALAGGRFHLRGNEFDVRQADIRFDDPTRIAPNVDVLAVTEYRRYSDTTAASAAGASSTGGVSAGGVAGSIWRITLHAYGDADNLHLTMTSDPPLSQEDIVLLLTIGMTRAEVDQLQAGSLGASAALEALATVSGADRAVKQAVPIIDDFSFGTMYVPRTGRTEPNVTVGKRLTENVRVSASSGLTSDENREVRSNLEWRLNQRLSVQGSYDNINNVSSTVGNVGVDLRWRLEFE
jgi:translocation and assembly module TamB